MENIHNFIAVCAALLASAGELVNRLCGGLGIVPFALGAVTITSLIEAVYSKTAEIVASADADTQAVLTHSLATANFEVTMAPATAVARTADWVLLGRTSTNASFGKTTATGSGTTAVTLQVTLRNPHSIIQ